jgi:co-chaperonin GroES (HSP10)
MKFLPLHDRVVVKRIDPEEKSAGGCCVRRCRARPQSRACL